MKRENDQESRNTKQKKRGKELGLFPSEARGETSERGKFFIAMNGGIFIN